MARLWCRCLNVVLHCKEEQWQARPVAGERVLPPGHRLRPLTLHEIELDLAGLTAVSGFCRLSGADVALLSRDTRLHPVGARDPAAVGGSRGLGGEELQ